VNARWIAVGLVAVALAGCGGGGGGGGGKPDAAAALDAVSGDLAGVFLDAAKQVVVLSKVPASRSKDAPACNRAMTKLHDAAPKRYSAFGAAHANGDLFCLSIPNSKPVNVTDRAYFQRALKTRGLGIGDYQIGRVTRKETVNAAYPLLDTADRPHGIVLAGIDLDWLNDRLERRFKDRGAEVVVVDSKGVVLARTPEAAGTIGKPAGDRRLVRAAGNPKGKGARSSSYAFGPVPGTKGWIWVGVRPAGDG
jgi:hypothetical protein